MIIEECINDIDKSIIYVLNNEKIAFINIRILYENIDILNILVKEEYRNKNIASKLMEYLIKNYSQHTFMLEVNENNEYALKLYKKYDFKEINKRKKYYKNDTAIIMKRG